MLTGKERHREMPRNMTLHQLETELNSFSAEARREALDEIARRIGRGEITVPPTHPLAAGANANLHMHSFFSFNADGHSPSRLAWEARKAGFFCAGVVDFDVLDGALEFLAAGDLLGLRTVVGVESRVFVSEYADREINSPREPGIAYYMGMGFHGLPEPGSEAARTLRRMRDLARKRNEATCERVNRYLGEARIDYEEDVLPLTPSGNATERHMLAAYTEKAARLFPTPSERSAYWSEKLGEPGRVTALVRDSVAFRELMRKRLMKPAGKDPKDNSGVGYAEPDKGSFPSLEEMTAMVADCRALNCATWLDGTSAGEADPEEVVAFYRSKGAVALNVIPDRNWNIEDREVRRRKVANLHAIVETAARAGLILVHGTERNKEGQPLVDDLSVEALSAVAGPLREGAYAVWGHTAMARHAGRPLGGEWCDAAFGEDAKAAGAFYAEVGRLLQPGPEAADRLATACEVDAPEDVLSRLGE